MNHPLVTVLLLLGLSIAIKESAAEINYVVSNTIRAAWERERFKNIITESEELSVEETEESEENDPLIRGPCFTKCSISVENRRSCEYTGTIKSKCLRKNCCWDDDENVADDKKCYRKEIGICPNPQCAAIAVRERITCLAAATNPMVTRSRAACIRAQCCWDENRGCYDMNTTVASFLSSLTTTNSPMTSQRTSTVAATTSPGVPFGTTTLLSSPETETRSENHVTSGVVTDASAATSSFTPSATAGTTEGAVQSTGTDMQSTETHVQSVETDVQPTETSSEASTAPALSTTVAVAREVEVSATDAAAASSDLGATIESTTIPASSSAPATSAQASTSAAETSASSIPPTTDSVASTEGIYSSSPSSAETDSVSLATVSVSASEPGGATSTESPTTTAQAIISTDASVSTAERSSPSPSASTPQYHATVTSLFPDTTPENRNRLVASRGPPKPSQPSSLFFQHQTTFSMPGAAKTTSTSTQQSAESSSAAETVDPALFYRPEERVPLPVGPHPTVMPESPEIEEGDASVTTDSHRNPEAGSWSAESTQAEVRPIATDLPSFVMPGFATEDATADNVVPPSNGPSPDVVNPIPMTDDDVVDPNTVVTSFVPSTQNILNRNLVLCWLGSSKLCKLSVIQSMSAPPTNQNPELVAMARNQPITSERNNAVVQPSPNGIVKKTSVEKPEDDEPTKQKKENIFKQLCRLVEDIGGDFPQWEVPCNAMKATEETAKMELPSPADFERGLISSKIPGVAATVGPVDDQPSGNVVSGRWLNNIVSLSAIQDSTCKAQRALQTGINFPNACYSPNYKKVESEAECISYGCCWMPTVETVFMDRYNIPHNSVTSWLLSKTLNVEEDNHQHCIRPMNGLTLSALYLASLRNEQSVQRQATKYNQYPDDRNVQVDVQTQPTHGGGCNYMPDDLGVSCGDYINNAEDCLAVACCWYPTNFIGRSGCFLPRDFSR